MTSDTTPDPTAPLHVLMVPGLTLPSISDDQMAQIGAAAGPSARLSLAHDLDEAMAVAAGNPDIRVFLGLMPEPLFDAMPALEWVHAIASGVDSYLYPSMRESAVVLTGEKGLVGEHLADHAFGLLLAITRRIGAAIRYGPEGWNRRPEMRFAEIELTGLTMGIIGFGGTGRAIARRAAAFGMTCIAVDRDPVPPTDEVPVVDGLDRLDHLLEVSDVVAVGCPLTPETDRMLDADAFARMKDTAILVNVTRGEVMDDDALVAALTSGAIAGAGLDVAPLEPLPADHPLWSIPTAILTPHTAGASPYRAGRNLARFCDNLERFRHGRTLDGIVDKQLGY